MSRGPKILFLVNWGNGGDWPFREAVASHVAKADILPATTFHRQPLSVLNRHSIEGSEFYLPLRALAFRRRYDIIVSWSLRLGIVYGLLNRFAGRGGALHVVQDFHINPLRQDPAYRRRLLWTRASQPGIDHYFCTSTEEEALYARIFGIPIERLRFLPQSPPSNYLSYPRQSPGDYIFAYGNSDRDFDTLVTACRGLDVPVRILSQRYIPTKPLPGNVELIRERRPETELMQLAAQARLVVIPLQDYRIAAGQLSMLEVMALARPVVVTENVATKEYAVHGETACFYQAGSPANLKERIQWLLANTDLADAMGYRARESVSLLHGRRVAIFLKVVHGLLT